MNQTCRTLLDELISDVFLWTPTHGRAKAGRPARTYIQQLCEDTGCCPEDLPEAMNDREKWRERIRDIRATSTTWWWWKHRRRLKEFWFIKSLRLSPWLFIPTKKQRRKLLKNCPELSFIGIRIVFIKFFTQVVNIITSEPAHWPSW